jgi:hypothetical protein
MQIMQTKEMARSEHIYLTHSNRLARLAGYWGGIALGYILQKRAAEAYCSATHAAHYGLLALQHPQPDPYAEQWRLLREHDLKKDEAA